MRNKKFKVTVSLVLTVIILMMSAALFAVSAWISIKGETTISGVSEMSVEAADIQATWKIKNVKFTDTSKTDKDNKDNTVNFLYGTPGAEMTADIVITTTAVNRDFVFEIDLGNINPTSGGMFLINNTTKLGEMTITGTDGIKGRIRESGGKYYGVIRAGDTNDKTIKVKLTLDSTLSNDSQAEEFFDNIKITCCQATKQALIDVFGQHAYNKLDKVVMSP